MAVTIEGPSPREANALLKAGEENIDVAEYHGSEVLKTAQAIHYFQLKHSTLRAEEPWVPSGVGPTIRAFAKRYMEVLAEIGGASLAGRVTFEFLTNRPIALDIEQALEDLRTGAAQRQPIVAEKIARFTNLTGAALKDFCICLLLTGDQPRFTDQRDFLVHESRAFLPGADADAPLHLKELVVTRATTARQSGRICRQDILRALKTEEEYLFPAQPRMEVGVQPIARLQEADIGAAVARATGPVLIHAEAGLGKSVLATRLGLHLPPGSVTVLYDCYGGGTYKRPASPRHGHREGLTQIINELASKGLCNLLIPSPLATPAEYVRTFVSRLEDAASATCGFPGPSIRH